MFQDDDPIRVEDSVDPMRNGNNSAVLEHIASKGCLQHSIGLHIYRCRRLVEYCQGTLVDVVCVIVNTFDLPRMFVGVSNALASEISCRCPADKLEPPPMR